MKFIVREKILSISDKFTIRNELGRDCYFVWGKIFSLGNKLHFEDEFGK